MNVNLIFYYTILAILVSLTGVSIYFKRYIYTYMLGGLIVLFSLLVFVYLWREDYNVHPMQTDKNYRNKVLWVNVDKIDILNDQHTNWAKQLLIKHAPNKLGIYSDKHNVTTLDILRYKETFYEVFGYDSEYIYFENAKLNNKTNQFCKDKNLRVNKISFRIN